MPIDFWAEVASPLKNPLKEAFLNYAGKLYENKNILLSSYFPSCMGGDMPSSDYLINMELKNIPKNFLTMGFGECFTSSFYEKFIKSGIYTHAEIIAWFPETMVIDVRRLGSRPVPKSFFDLTDSCYCGEICIIGTPQIPDPLAALFIYKQFGLTAAKAFAHNLAGFGAPVNAIRHIGRNSNTFGSIFIMPLLFANVCRELKNALVIQPSEGYLAEPFILYSKAENCDNEKRRYIKEFLTSKVFEEISSEKIFFKADSRNNQKIFHLCQNTYFPELEFVYPVLCETMKHLDSIKKS